MSVGTGDHQLTSSRMEITTNSFEYPQIAMPAGLDVATNDTSIILYQQVYEMNKLLSDNIEIINDDAQHLSSKLLRLQSILQSLTQEMSIVKLSVQEKNAFIDG